MNAANIAGRASTEAAYAPARRVACVVSVTNPLRVRAGNTAYLTSMAGLLRRNGFDVHLLVLQPVYFGSVRTPLLPEPRAAFASVWGHRSVARGDSLVSVDWRFWMERLRRRLGAPTPKAHGGAGRWIFETAAPDALRAAADRIAALRADLVLANYHNAATVFSLVAAKTVKALLLHDLLVERAGLFLARSEAPDFDPAALAQEDAAIRSADLCVAIQDAEAETLRRLWPGVAVVVAPHVIEVALPETEPLAGTLVFVGSDSSANREGLQWFLANVWPKIAGAMPDASLRVVGSVANGIDNAPPGVVLVGGVEDLVGEYARARVAVAPLLSGSGLKIKIVEALAVGRPVVTSAVGMQGIVGAPPDGLVIADDPSGFAAATTALLRMPDTAWRETCARCVGFARARYGVDAIAQRLGDAIDRARAVARPDPPSAG